MFPFPTQENSPQYLLLLLSPFSFRPLLRSMPSHYEPTQCFVQVRKGHTFWAVGLESYLCINLKKVPSLWAEADSCQNRAKWLQPGLIHPLSLSTVHKLFNLMGSPGPHSTRFIQDSKQGQYKVLVDNSSISLWFKISEDSTWFPLFAPDWDLANFVNDGSSTLSSSSWNIEK